MMTLTDTPPSNLKTVLSEGLADHNARQSRLRDWRPLAVMVHDPATGDAAGGLLGRTSMGLFFLDLFFLPEHVRGSGMGSRALRMAEEEARRRGCKAATLVTLNFQAPEFYAQHGWEEFGRIASAPGVERIFMRKALGACCSC